MRLLTVLILALAAGGAAMERARMNDAAAAVPGELNVATVPGEAPVATDELTVMPGWPVLIGCSGNFGPVRGVALADFDGDDRLEVIRGSTTNQMYVWRYDGTAYPGWPKTLNNMVQEAAAVADVDCDGEYEVCVNTRGMTSGGKTYLLREDGTNETGWPFTGPTNGNMSSSPCLADLNGDDTLEIIVTERATYALVHVLNTRGQEFSADWPCTLDAVPTGTPAVADINLDGVKEVVTYSYNSLYVFRPDGALLPGFPVQVANANFSYQSPALADIDGDDTLEIVVAMHRNAAGCYVFRHDGTLQTGWPFSFPRWTYCPPTIADLYRNGDLKVLCGLSGIMGGAAQVLYGFDDDGSVLTGFPIVQPNGDAAEGNITVADLDADTDMEVVFTSNLMYENKGYIFAVHHDGSAVSGFPLRPAGFSYLNGVTVADVDGDDSLDLVGVASANNQTEVTVWEANVPFSRACWEWPTYHFDMARTGRYVPYSTGVAEPGRGVRPRGRFVLAPNPARTGMRLGLAGCDAAQVRMYDRSGKLVAELPVTGSTVSVPAILGAGVYIARAGGRSARLVIAE